jgi:hypothetical protein
VLKVGGLWLVVCGWLTQIFRSPPFDLFCSLEQIALKNRKPPTTNHQLQTTNHKLFFS